MGLQDQDPRPEWENGRSDSPFTSVHTGSLGSWIAVVSLLVALAAGFVVYERTLVQRAEPTTATAFKVNPAVVAREEWLATAPGPAVRCSVNGQARYTEADCLGGRSSRPETANRPTTQALEPAPSGLSRLYFCKGKDGANIWTDTHCDQHNASVDHVVDVARAAPTTQKVVATEARRQNVVMDVPPAAPRHLTTNAVQPGPSAKALECKSLNEQVAKWDAMARQPQSGGTQDWIREQRKAARDRQFALRC